MWSPIQVVDVGAFAWSFVRLTADLSHLDDVFRLNDRLMRLRDEAAERKVVDAFRQSPAGSRALRSRPRLGRLDLHALVELPTGTLGETYARFMLDRGLSPTSIPDLTARSDVEYIVAHLYETHDLWHVITGFDTDPAGEGGVQAFYLAQQRAYLPFFVLSAILMNTAVRAYEDKDRRLDAIANGWLLGKRAAPLAGIDWLSRFHQPIAEVRRELGVEPYEAGRSP